MQKSVLNKQGKFGVKILWRYTDVAIFVLRCFILTHPVICQTVQLRYKSFLSVIIIMIIIKLSDTQYCNPTSITVFFRVVVNNTRKPS